jgi:protease-4
MSHFHGSAFDVRRSVFRRVAVLLVVGAVLVAGEARGTVVVTLTGGLELRPAEGLFGGGEPSLHQSTQQLREALGGPEPRLVLDLSRGFSPGLAAAEELAAVLRERAPGRRVACLIDRCEDSVLVVAAACDEVVIPIGGMTAVHGLAAETWYLAGALARLGVRFHAVASGPFKTAPEMFTSDGPSDQARAETRHLLAALDRTLVALSLRPGFDAAALAKARESGLQTAAAARTLGLATAAAEPGAWFAAQPQPLRRLRSGPEAPDLGSLAGMMRFWGQLLGGDTGTRPARSVAVVELAGMIVPGEHSMPGETVADGDTVAMLDRLRDDRRVAAVVLRIDSGGGDAGASDRIHHAVRRLDAAKPVVCLMDGVAASGGYWIACAAREIRVHRATITGSIGAFALVPDLDGAIGLLGVKRHVELGAPQADLFHPGGWDEGKAAAYRALIADVDNRFRNLVAERRKLPRERVDRLAEGRVFTGEQAVAEGLADGLGTLGAAVARARELAREPAPLPLERFPRGSGLAARLGLVDATSFVPGARRLALLAELARRGPLILALQPVPSVR